MALVEDGALLGSRQLDMGNSGLRDAAYTLLPLPKYISQYFRGLLIEN